KELGLAVDRKKTFRADAQRQRWIIERLYLHDHDEARFDVDQERGERASPQHLHVFHDPDDVHLEVLLSWHKNPQCLGWSSLILAGSLARRKDNEAAYADHEATAAGGASDPRR